MFLFWLARLSVFPMEQHAVVCKDLFPAMGLCSFSRDCEQPDLEFSKSFICFCRAFLFICAPHVPASYDMYNGLHCRPLRACEHLELGISICFTCFYSG